MTTPDDTSAKIAALNDQFRQTFEGGRVLITQAVHHLPEDIQAQIIDKVRRFDAFTEEVAPRPNQ